MGHYGGPCDCGDLEGITLHWVCTKCKKPTDPYVEQNTGNPGKKKKGPGIPGKPEITGEWAGSGKWTEDSSFWKQNKPEQAEGWKDHELDYIWHHGVKLMVEGKIDQYELLNRIEEQISNLLAKQKQQMEDENLNLLRKKEIEWSVIFNREIKKLKQQHKEELESFFNNVLKEIYDRPDVSPELCNELRSIFDKHIINSKQDK